MTVHFCLYEYGYVRVYEILPDGRRHDLVSGYRNPGDYYLSGFVEQPLGVWTLWIELWVGDVL